MKEKLKIEKKTLLTKFIEGFEEGDGTSKVRSFWHNLDDKPGIKLEVEAVMQVWFVMGGG